jgi:hypothetical protein
LIVKENKGESGIYMWTNKITGDIYIGQSSNLAVRFTAAARSAAALF